jgi:hypothetical protein
MAGKKNQKRKNQKHTILTPEQQQQHIRDGMLDSVALLRAYLRDDEEAMNAILNSTPCQNCLLEWTISCSVALVTADCDEPDDIAEAKTQMDRYLAEFQHRMALTSEEM